MPALRELSRLIARRTGPHGTWENTALGLRFGTSSHVPEPSHRVYAPVFALVVQGEKQLVLGDEVFTCGKGTFIVVSVDLPLTFRISRATRAEPYVVLALTLKPAAVAALLLEAAVVERSPVTADPAGIGVSEATDELVESVLRLVRLLDHPRDLPVLGPIAEKELLWRLLCGEQGQRLRQIGLADGRLAQIGRAVRFMRENFRENRSIEELARLSAMSVTSFHRHFRAVALMSPLQYLKQIRLQEARARLLAGAADIATVGHDVGYESASQFSREYKRAFGSPPGHDARLLRASNGRR
jgi:AraC-like DNA-binding protein